MAEETFKSAWCGDSSMSQKWLDALEKTGVASVRARLAQIDAGSAGSFAIGTVSVMTIGFAQEWATWKENQKTAADIERHERQIRWTKTAAISAAIAASGALGFGQSSSKEAEQLRRDVLVWTASHPHGRWRTRRPEDERKV
jgi:hypothetical protein